MNAVGYFECHTFDVSSVIKVWNTLLPKRKSNPSGLEAQLWHLQLLLRFVWGSKSPINS